MIQNPISAGAAALILPPFASPRSALRNAWLLSTAAVLCNAFFLWVLARATFIDSLFPQDSRVGIMVFFCWPVWPMGVVFWLRTVITRWHSVFPLPARRSATGAVIVSTLSVACVVGFAVRNGLASGLVPEFAFMAYHPGIIPALVLALWSVRRDVVSAPAKPEAPSF